MSYYNVLVKLLGAIEHDKMTREGLLNKVYKLQQDWYLCQSL